jgi:3-oxoacyl-[acyl-carrier-protein] synthase II
VDRHSVVITGMGILAANAGSAMEYSRALQEGRSGIRTISRFDPGWPFRQGGEVDLDDADAALDRVSQLAVSAAVQAVRDAGLEPGGPWRRTAGLCLGTSRGPAQSLETVVRKQQPAGGLLQEIPFYSVARNVSRRLALQGPVSTITMACVSSSLAIGRAMDTLQRGRAKIMFAGGADCLTNLSFSGFSVLRAMTHTLCRPFDRRRDGMVLGEGAGVLVLEDLEHATARGARVYAELRGWGTAGDAHHATSPHPEGRGLAAAMTAALRRSGLSSEDIDHVNLHGTGTAANDPAECHAMRRAFGPRSAEIPVNSLKPMIGHTLGAAGVLELAGSVLAMLGGFVPATLNSEHLDPACPLDVVRGQSRPAHVRTLMSTKSAFGGANVAIVAAQP